MMIGEQEFMEECWFIHGIRLFGRYRGVMRYHSQGDGASVEIDWQKALKSPFLIGWMHTHPGIKSISPSSTDHRTMRSWVRGLGRPLLCGIRCGDEVAIYKFFRSSYDPDSNSSPIAYTMLDYSVAGKYIEAWQNSEAVTYLSK